MSDTIEQWRGARRAIEKDNCRRREYRDDMIGFWPLPMGYSPLVP